MERRVKEDDSLFRFHFPADKENRVFQTIELFLRAVSRSRSSGRPRVFRVRLDRFDHQVEFVGAVDLARYAVVAVWRDELGFGEVIQPIDAVRGVILHEEHGAGAVFRPREQEQMIGAEVEHEVREEARAGSSGPTGSAVEGLPGGLLRAGISPQRGACSKPAQSTRPADSDSCWPCAGCRRRAGRSRSSRPAGRRWRWRWSC